LTSNFWTPEEENTVLTWSVQVRRWSDDASECFYLTKKATAYCQLQLPPPPLTLSQSNRRSCVSVVMTMIAGYLQIILNFEYLQIILNFEKTLIVY